MYVGITRAMQTLTLTYSSKRKFGGESLPTTPSRFLEELPADELEWEGRSSGRSVEQKQALGNAHLSNLKNLFG